MKDQTAGYLRLEMILEPEATLEHSPSFLLNPVNGGRRLIGSVPESDVGLAVEWASKLRQNRVVEEFSIGPTTLEDAYLNKVGRADALEVNGKEGKTDVNY